MKKSEVKASKKAYINMRLLADEQEDMIERSLERGTMYVCNYSPPSNFVYLHKRNYRKSNRDK